MDQPRLNQLVTIQWPTETRGATFKDVQTDWTAVSATVWARIATAPGREVYAPALGQVQGQGSVTITTRYRGDVTNKCRVVFGGRTFEVKWVQDFEERHEYLHLTCAELADG
jgi:SPP1 family predicted phage head-tail adaptor